MATRLSSGLRRALSGSSLTTAISMHQGPHDPHELPGQRGDRLARPREPRLRNQRGVTLVQPSGRDRLTLAERDITMSPGDAAERAGRPARVG
ncbi:hypothetical protein [Actinophytocola sp. NPDC049390]|uniref:hypothetical protein n=1 Tax=Actinophytocola sp. NPDC049390 TaxID=3363894 RepID=UPI00378F751E